MQSGLQEGCTLGKSTVTAAAVLSRAAPDLCATGRGSGLAPSLFEGVSVNTSGVWEELVWRLEGRSAILPRLLTVPSSLLSQSQVSSLWRQKADPQKGSFEKLAVPLSSDVNEVPFSHRKPLALWARKEGILDSLLACLYSGSIFYWKCTACQAFLGVLGTIP